LSQDVKVTTERGPVNSIRSLLTVLAASALGCAATSTLLLQRISAGFDLRYSDSRQLMLGEADGYYHLYRSQEILAGKTAWFNEPPLSGLGAAVHLITRLPLETVAFWLPVGIAMTLGLWYWGWGRLLRVPTGYAALATFTGCFLPTWFFRACPGWYDTDPGIAFFWHGGLFATACLGLSPGRPRIKHVVLLLACTLGLSWWWQPGFAMLPLCIFLWGATGSFSQDRFWRKVRLATCVAVVLCCLIFLLLPASSLPDSVIHYRDYAKTHAGMVFGLTKDVVFRSIDELKPLSIFEILQGLGGNPLAGALALCSAALLCWRHPRGCIFLLPSLLALGLAFFAERFLYFAALPIALGLGLLPDQVPWLKGQPRWGDLLPSNKKCTLLTWAVSLGILASTCFELAVTPLDFYFQAPQDRIALTIKRVVPPTAKLWNWWDDGYFLAARSGHAPLFDGGSQTPQLSYLAAHPLVSEDPFFASRWIRFFALRGEGALDPLRAAWGSDSAVWKNLDTIFSAREIKTALTSLPPLPLGAEWFLPEGRVFLYLPQRFLKLSQWWIGMGSTRDPDVHTLRPHIDTFKRTAFRFDVERNQVILPEEVIQKGYKDFGGVFLTSRTPLAPPWGGDKPGPYVVTSDFTPWLYIVDEDAIRSVGFRLLAPGGQQLPGFAPLLVNYAYGGLWEVLP